MIHILIHFKIILVSLIIFGACSVNDHDQVEINIALNSFFINSRSKTIPSEVQRIDLYVCQLVGSSEKILQQRSFVRGSENISLILSPGKNILFAMEAVGEDLETILYAGESDLYDLYPGETVNVLIRMSSLLVEGEEFQTEGEGEVSSPSESSVDILVNNPLEGGKVYSPLVIRGQSEFINRKNSKGRDGASYASSKIVARMYNEAEDIIGFSSRPTEEDGSFDFNLSFIEQEDGDPLVLEVSEILNGVPVSNKILNLIQYRLDAEARLSDLTLSAGFLKTSFDSDTYQYEGHLDLFVQKLKITPTAINPEAIILVDGQEVASGQESQEFNIVLGTTVIDIMVVAVDGTAVEYTFNFKQWELLSNRMLNELNLDNYNADGFNELSLDSNILVISDIRDSSNAQGI